MTKRIYVTWYFKRTKNLITYDFIGSLIIMFVYFVLTFISLNTMLYDVGTTCLLMTVSGIIALNTCGV